MTITTSTKSLNVIIDDDKKVQSLNEVIDIESTHSGVDEIFGEEKRLNRGLKQRHIQMLALVGVFGTGLFLSSGTTLYLTGNVGMFLSYLFVGALVGLNQLANIELSCFVPLTSATVRQTEHFIDESYGFALGWIQVYAGLMPGELAATALVMHYWSDLNPAVWLSIFIVIIVALNSYSIRFYGEVEFGFGCLKILLITGLILLSVIIDLGGVPKIDRIGFRYWKESPFKAKYKLGSAGKFLAWWKASSSTIYAFGGISSISFFGGETRNPRRAIYVAGKRIFYRVFVLYILTVLGLTLILSSKDSAIASPTGDATGSPFVIAIERAGIKGLPSIINALVLSSAFSAANLSMVHTSRNLFALASKGQAPRIFLKTNKRGLPYYGVILAGIFMPLSYMNVSSGSSTVFGWFQSLTSSNLLIGWISISLSHIGLQRALKAQGYTRNDLPYTMPYAHVGAYILLFFFVILLLTGGFPNFIKGHFAIGSFFSSYFSIAYFAVFYIFWKIWKRTKFIEPTEVDLQSLFIKVQETPEPPAEPLKGWKVLTLLWS
ncbi:CIC11C00000005010 [Sungouiella intermedia]|uniref:CIC11C00000005010 n=1 Tax=Sungouiella intermedia TaxID=45354 RepID=A0A1L0BHZ0_9ASCO|nr:CIC11C00000005010 [[Candida] intermedia]